MLQATRWAGQGCVGLGSIAKDSHYLEMRWLVLLRFAAFCLACHLLLNNFTDWSDDPIHWNPEHLNNTDCAAFAKSTLRHGALHLPKHIGLHLSYDIRAFAGNIHNLNNSSILLVRTEFLWRDWESANRWLGEKGEILSGAASRNSSSFELPISKQMSDSGRRNLCIALKDEYNLYLRLLGRAANLSEREKLESLKIAQRNCPELKLKL